MVKKILKLEVHKMVMLSLVLLLFSSIFVYYFSADSHVKVLSCTNNYYLSDSEIYDLANVSTKTRLFLSPSFVLEKKVEKMPFVQSCKVSKQNRKLTFDVQEKVIVGYYVSKNKNYALCIDGTSIEIQEKYLNTIVHFPLLSGLNAKRRKLLCTQLQKNEKIITRDLIEKIAEIVPYKTSYDKNMFKLTMQDGNIVYTNLKSIKMLSKYQSVLTKLKGQSVCLVLDSTHSTIEKVTCDDLNGKKKKTTKKEKEDTQENQTEDTSDTTNQDTQETTDQEQVDDTQQDTSEDGTSSIEYDENTGLYYDSNTGYYYDDAGQYYYWDEDLQQLVQAQ